MLAPRVRHEREDAARHPPCPADVLNGRFGSDIGAIAVREADDDVPNRELGPAVQLARDEDGEIGFGHGQGCPIPA